MVVVAVVVVYVSMVIVPATYLPCVCVCYVPTSLMHTIKRCIKTQCATYEVRISPGSHECRESGRAIGRVQALSLVALKALLSVPAAKSSVSLGNINIKE